MGRDLDAARRDLGAFADLVGCPLEPWQAVALDVHARPQRETAIVGPRRSGKSRGAAVAALWHCFRGAERHALVISSAEEGAKRLLSEASRVATRSPVLAASVVDERSQVLRLSNGSSLRCTAPTDAAVRGWSASLVIADEATMVSEPVLVGAARPIIASEAEGRVLLISSPTQASGAFFDSFRRGEAGSAHTAAFRWRLVDCSWISPSEVEAARETMSPPRFASEYLAEFQSGADSLFSRAALEAVTVDFRAESLGSLPAPARLLGGIDWGERADRSAFVAVGRLAGEDRFGVVCAHRWREGEPIHRVVGDVVGSPGHFHVLASEANGLGGPCSQALFRGFEDRSRSDGGGPVPSRRLAVVDLDDLLDSEDRERERRDQTLPGWMAPHFGLPVPPPVAPPFRSRLRRVVATATTKATVWQSVRLAVDRGRLLVPASATDLRRELAALRVELTAAGSERIEAPGRAADDLCDALAAAAFPFRDGDGRWHCYLGDLVDERRRLPLPRLPDGFVPGPVVRNAAGTAAPAAPVWQSVFGEETCIPGGVGPGEEGPVAAYWAREREAAKRVQAANRP